MNELLYPALTCVVAVLINPRTAEVLSVSRKPRPGDSPEQTARRLRDLGFPGGKVEPGETEVQAIVRELREELGIEVMGPIPHKPVWSGVFDNKVLHRPDRAEVFLLFYLVGNYFNGTPRNREGQGLGWFTEAEMTALREQGALAPGIDGWVAAADFIVNGGLTHRATIPELRISCAEMLQQGRLPQLRKEIETKAREALRPRAE